MKSDKRRLNKIEIASIIIILIIIGIILWMVYDESMREEEDRKKREAYQEAVKLYEDEIAEIRLDLQKRKEDIEKYDGVGVYFVGYQVSSVDDISRIKEDASRYSLKPVVIFDTADSEDFVQEVLDKVDFEYDVMINCSTDRGDSFADANTIREKVLSINKDIKVGFVLRSNTDTDKNYKRALEDKYDMISRYAEEKLNGIDDGVPYCNYCFVSNNGTIINYLDIPSKSEGTMLIAFDMNAVSGGRLTLTEIDAWFEKIDSQVSEGIMRYGSLGDAIEKIIGGAEMSETKKKAYEEYKTEKQKRIDELYDKIKDIREEMKIN